MPPKSSTWAALCSTCERAVAPPGHAPRSLTCSWFCGQLTTTLHAPCLTPRGEGPAGSSCSAPCAHATC